MGRFIDLAGKKFGLLTAIERVESSRSGDTRWFCKCDCGNSKQVRAQELRNGHIRPRSPNVPLGHSLWFSTMAIRLVRPPRNGDNRSAAFGNGPYRALLQQRHNHPTSIPKINAEIASVASAVMYAVMVAPEGSKGELSCPTVTGPPADRAKTAR